MFTSPRRIAALLLLLIAAPTAYAKAHPANDKDAKDSHQDLLPARKFETKEQKLEQSLKDFLEDLNNDRLRTKDPEVSKTLLKADQALHAAQIKTVNANSPIKIGGGSMTAYSHTVKNGGWNPKSEGSSSYCAGISSLGFYTTADLTSGSVPAMLQIGWTVRAHGRDPSDATESSSRGLQFEIADGACSGGASTTYSVKLTAFDTSGNGNADFYPDELVSDGKTKREHRRFLDKTPDIAGTAGCSGPNVPPGSPLIGNEDRCERMSTIEILNGTVSIATFDCTEGDCYFTIGN